MSITSECPQKRSDEEHDAGALRHILSVRSGLVNCLHKASAAPLEALGTYRPTKAQHAKDHPPEALRETPVDPHEPAALGEPSPSASELEAPSAAEEPTATRASRRGRR